MAEKFAVGAVPMADDDVTRAVRALIKVHKVASARLFWAKDDIKVYEYRYVETSAWSDEKYDAVYMAYILVSKERNLWSGATTQLPVMGSMARFIRTFDVDFNKLDGKYYEEQYNLAEIDYFATHDVMWGTRWYNNKFTSNCPCWIDHLRPLCPANNL
jgi:hypothetical protein